VRHYRLGGSFKSILPNDLNEGFASWALLQYLFKAGVLFAAPFSLSATILGFHYNISEALAGWE
jgi:hypothetical protein